MSYRNIKIFNDEDIMYSYFETILQDGRGIIVLQEDKNIFYLKIYKLGLQSIDFHFYDYFNEHDKFNIFPFRIYYDYTPDDMLEVGAVYRKIYDEYCKEYKNNNYWIINLPDEFLTSSF